MIEKFRVEFLLEAEEFMERLDEKARRKIYFNIQKAQVATLVLATHGLVKKTGKTPQADLDKAERIRQLYFDNKIY